MLKNIAAQDETSWKPPVENQPFPIQFALELPDVPVLRETLLLLDLKAQEPCVDLREVSEIILADAGATLQLLRFASREYGDVEYRPQRIEDCISDFGLRACIECMSVQTLSYGNRHLAAPEVWQHATEIAYHCKLVAEEMPDVNPEEAYLAGLLHNIGVLPVVLGWDLKGESAADEAFTGFNLARKWALPPCVVDFFSEMYLTGYPKRWMPIVEMAHQRADRSLTDCPFEQAIGPQLHMQV